MVLLFTVVACGESARESVQGAVESGGISVGAGMGELAGENPSSFMRPQVGPDEAERVSLGGGHAGDAAVGPESKAGGGFGGATVGTLDCNTTDLGMATGWVVTAGRDAYVDNGRVCPPAGSGLAETSFLWTAPVSGDWHFATNSFCSTNPALSLSAPECGGVELGYEENTPGLFGGARVVRRVERGESLRVALHQESLEDARPIGLHVTLGSELHCDDGLDDDLDGAVDCFDEDCVETCESVDTGTEPGSGGAAGDTNSCGATDLGSEVGQVVTAAELAPDRCSATLVAPPTYTWKAPHAGNWKFVALPCGSGWPTVSIRLPVCNGAEIAFDDNSPEHLGNVAMAEVELGAGEEVSIHLGFEFWPEHPQVATATTLRIFEGERPQETECSDGLDDDFDERTDCYDPDCKAAPECCDFYYDDCD